MPPGCRTCPLLLACREWSLSLPSTDTAIYGGLSAAERIRACRERLLAAQELARGGRRHPDYGETMRERAERKRQENPVRVVQTGGGDLGSVPVYGRA